MSTYNANDAPPCRRRAIWAAQGSVPNVVQDVPRETKVETVQEVSKYACKKCGKEYRRGMYFHFKNCKG